MNRYGVTPGQQVAVFTNNDDGWRTAADLAAKGIAVTNIIDTRDAPAVCEVPGARHIRDAAVMDTVGRKGLKAVTLTSGQVIPTDCLAVSGGWNPNVHLTCHQRGRPTWREDINAFVPGGDLPPGMAVAGAANGSLTLAAALSEGRNVANAQIKELGFTPSRKPTPKAEDEPSDGMAIWHIPESTKRAWVDQQNDVTVKDIKQSYREGFRSVEHLKRYTTLGMATDQGKTANIPALAIMAECTGKSLQDTGTTIFRPPYTPIPMGALAGRARGQDFRPFRLTPSHDWASKNGATFVEVGNWLRAQWFARPGEQGWRDSVDREVADDARSISRHLRRDHAGQDRHSGQGRRRFSQRRLRQRLW